MSQSVEAGNESPGGGEHRDRIGGPEPKESRDVDFGLVAKEMVMAAGDVDLVDDRSDRGTVRAIDIFTS
jgi:hypothetical protein